MTQEEKDLIFKDLCGRLSYGVKLRNLRKKESDIGYIVKLYAINLDEYYCKIQFYTFEGKALCVSDEDNLFKVGNRDVDFLRYKPYLFPLSSMTNEQKKELQSLMTQDSYGILYHTIESYDYLNKNHFDFRGLILRGFAIDATNLNIY